MARIHVIDKASSYFGRMMSSLLPKPPRAIEPAGPYRRARYIRNRSKYTPHQGQRERLRRVVGGFAGPANRAKPAGDVKRTQMADCTVSLANATN